MVDTTNIDGYALLSNGNNIENTTSSQTTISINNALIPNTTLENSNKEIENSRMTNIKVGKKVKEEKARLKGEGEKDTLWEKIADNWFWVIGIGIIVLGSLAYFSVFMVVFMQARHGLIKSKWHWKYVSDTITELTFTEYAFELKEFPDLSRFKNLQVLNVGAYNFGPSNFIIENMTNLQTITLGDHSFYGDKRLNCSLIMKNLPALTTFISEGYSFHLYHSAYVENVPNVQKASLHHAFINITDDRLDNIADALERVIPPAARDIKTIEDYENLPEYTRKITCNKESIYMVTELDLTRFKYLREVDMTERCFNSIQLVNMTNLPYLTRFATSDLSWFHYKRLQFICVNNPRLEELTFRYNALNTFDEVQLENLPKLKSITCDVNALVGNKKNPECIFTMKNLPSLTTFSAKENSLQLTNYITLENIPVLHTIHLNNPFETAKKITVSNVSNVFQYYIPNVLSKNDFETLPSTTERIIMRSKAMENEDKLDLSRFNNLYYLNTRNNNYKQANFTLINEPEIETFIVGSYCFLNESPLTIKNVPKLQELIIGDNTLTATDLVLKDLLQLRHLQLGNECFRNSIHTELKSYVDTVVLSIDLPRLYSMILGVGAAKGKDRDDSSLIMQDLPSLGTIDGAYTFEDVHIVTMENIPNVFHVNISGRPFFRVKSSTIHNVAPCLADLVEKQSD